MTWFPQKQARAADAKDARVEWHCPTSARTWQLMLMMLWSVGPAVDHVQEAAQLMLGSVARLLIMRNEWLMLMMRGFGLPGCRSCARSCAAHADDDAGVGWRGSASRSRSYVADADDASARVGRLLIMYAGVGWRGSASRSRSYVADADDASARVGRLLIMCKKLRS